MGNQNSTKVASTVAAVVDEKAHCGIKQHWLVKKIKSLAQAVLKLRLSEGIGKKESKSVNQSISQSVEKSAKYKIFKIL